MRCLAVCQTELAIRMLEEVLLSNFEIEFLVEGKPLAKRLHDSGLNVSAGDPRRTDTYIKADITPGTCVVVEDDGRHSLKRILEAIWNAGATLVYVLGVGVGTAHAHKREEELKAQFPELNYLSLSELFGGPLLTEFSRSLTRLRVQQYQRFFADADKVVILLHNDPDPDAMASGLALRGGAETHAADRGHRGAPGRDPAREPADGEPAGHPHRDHQARRPEQLRPRGDGGCAAALLLGRHRPRGPGDRPPSRADRLQRGLQGHPRRLRVHVHDPHRAPARRGREHLGTHRHGDALRDQVRHPVLQSPGQPGGHRGLLLPLSPRRRRDDPEDGGRRHHARAPRSRDPGRGRTAGSRTRCTARSSATCRARISSPTLPTSTCSSRTSSGRSSWASSTTPW